MTVTELSLPRRTLAELLGSALLAAIVIGSGIAAQSLSPSDTGLQLLQNAIATGAGLFAIILMFGPASGAHFNPVVTLVDATLGERPWRDVAAYLPAQVLGCILGAVLANMMFDLAPISISSNDRLTGAHFLAETVATVGLVLVIFALTQTGRSHYAAAAVGAYIAAAYYFTSSTSFANPAITVGRIFSDSFAGIAPSSVLGFIAAQLIGGAVGLAIVRVLYSRSRVAAMAEPAVAVD
ncbi:MAG: MIP/aquaporin family protein [Microbacteriaceae bacterium]